MNAQAVWDEFRDKLRFDSLTEHDFTDEMRSFLSSFLSGDAAQSRREKFLYSPIKTIDSDHKKIVILSCPDDEYRFDFMIHDGKWQLSFIEGITLPLENIDKFPYTSFPSLPEKETWIAAEKREVLT